MCVDVQLIVMEIEILTLGKYMQIVIRSALAVSMMSYFVCVCLGLVCFAFNFSLVGCRTL